MIGLSNGNPARCAGLTYFAPSGLNGNDDGRTKETARKRRAASWRVAGSKACATTQAGQPALPKADAIRLRQNSGYGGQAERGPPGNGHGKTNRKHGQDLDSTTTTFRCCTRRSGCNKELLRFRGAWQHSGFRLVGRARMGRGWLNACLALSALRRYGIFFPGRRPCHYPHLCFSSGK